MDQGRTRRDDRRAAGGQEGRCRRSDSSRSSWTRRSSARTWQEPGVCGRRRARRASFYDGVQTGGAAATARIARDTSPARTACRSPRSLDDDLALRPAAELAAIFAKAGVKPGDTVIGYCHIGQQATAMLFAARTLGHHRAAVRRFVRGLVAAHGATRSTTRRRRAASDTPVRAAAVRGPVPGGRWPRSGAPGRVRARRPGPRGVRRVQHDGGRRGVGRGPGSGRAQPVVRVLRRRRRRAMARVAAARGRRGHGRAARCPHGLHDGCVWRSSEALGSALSTGFYWRAVAASRWAPGRSSPAAVPAARP